MWVWRCFPISDIVIIRLLMKTSYFTVESYPLSIPNNISSGIITTHIKRTENSIKSSIFWLNFTEFLTSIDFNPFDRKMHFSQVLTNQQNVLIAFSNCSHRQIVSMVLDQTWTHILCFDIRYQWILTHFKKKVRKNTLKLIKQF